MTEKFKYPDAYILMEYTCEKCGEKEDIWNSRNGVAPFMVECRKCDGIMQHTNWQDDQWVPWFKLFKGDRYFASLTEESAFKIARINVESFDGTEYELAGDEKESVIKELAEGYLRDDMPDILTAGEENTE